MLLCEKHLPPNREIRFENERMRLMRDVKELKLAQSIPQYVQALRQRANPRLLLAPQAPPVVEPVGAVPNPGEGAVQAGGSATAPQR